MNISKEKSFREYFRIYSMLKYHLAILQRVLMHASFQETTNPTDSNHPVENQYTTIGNKYLPGNNFSIYGKLFPDRYRNTTVSCSQSCLLSLDKQ